MNSDDWKKHYKQVEQLGSGGNGRVLKVKGISDQKEYALKVLHSQNSPVNKKRFLDEIKIMKENYQKITGIMPVLDFSKTGYWYTMPIAEPILSHIQNNASSIEIIIKGVMALAETLEKLHYKGISHRDIKPANIYYYNGRYYLGDFGIASILSKDEHNTRTDRGLGAIFTIAPEMKRNPRDADGKKADVFSLAKTLWMLLAQDDKGFDGVYDFLDKTHGLRFKDNLKNIHLVEIEELLVQSTQNDPLKRPSIEQFIVQLQVWLDTYNHLDKAQQSEWNFLNKMLFGDGKYIPNTCVWKGIDEIKDVLKLVIFCRSYNHMMFPDGGGEDLTDVNVAHEKNCLYLYAGGICNIVQPSKLTYERFPDNPFFNYFLLEAEEIYSIISKGNYSYEHLIEDTPSHYVDSKYFQYGVYDYDTGEKLPDGAKLVNRYYKGKFLIVPKRGYYNLISSTYDGRHNAMNSEDFRKYIDAQSEIVSILKQTGFSKECICSILDNKFARKVSNKCANKYKSHANYILEHYKEWSFKKFLRADGINKNTQFYIVFENNFNDLTVSDSGDFFDVFQKQKLYLCKDGKIKYLPQENISEAYCVSNREIAIEVMNSCQHYINNICSENKFDIPLEQMFKIEFRQNEKCKHHFTKNKIENLMRNADDRKNNVLVVDEYGNVDIIQNISIAYTYPVRLEAFCAGNNYVGKYSSLSTSDNNYLALLLGWLQYLETNIPQLIDFPVSKDETYLISEIRKKTQQNKLISV